MLDGVTPTHFDRNFFEIIDDVENSNAPVVKNILGDHTFYGI
jgi:hypothetical protein